MSGVLDLREIGRLLAVLGIGRFLPRGMSLSVAYRSSDAYLYEPDQMSAKMLLAAGDALRFKRPRVGQTHKAVVTADGTLSLEGGQVFRSPSRAAAVAADMPAVDGWHTWMVVSSGRSLDSLRQELLDQVAAGTTGETVMAESAAVRPQDRYEWLKEARARADAKDPVEISIRDLLARWDAKARGTRINQRIEADLANH